VTHALAVLALLAPAAAAAADLVGPETCKPCHPAAYASWRDGPHARALETLPERSRGDRRCLSCHAPDLSAGVSAVSCEACHGPGAIYSARYVMRDAELARAVGLVEPGEKTCLACHTESTPSLEKFVYDKKLPLIVHWGQGGAARAKAPTPPTGAPGR
jgi:hypothetical protein